MAPRNVELSINFPGLQTSSVYDTTSHNILLQTERR